MVKESKVLATPSKQVESKNNSNHIHNANKNLHESLKADSSSKHNAVDVEEGAKAAEEYMGELK